MNKSMVLFGVDWRYKKWDVNYYRIHYVTSSAFEIDEAWVKDARLVAIQRRFMGTFDRQFTIKDFRMRDYTVERQQALSAPQLPRGQ